MHIEKLQREVCPNVVASEQVPIKGIYSGTQRRAGEIEIN